MRKGAKPKTRSGFGANISPLEARRAVEAFALSEWEKMTPSQREIVFANVKANARELSRIRRNIKRRKLLRKAKQASNRKLGVKE